MQQYWVDSMVSMVIFMAVLATPIDYWWNSGNFRKFIYIKAYHWWFGCGFVYGDFLYSSGGFQRKFT